MKTWTYAANSYYKTASYVLEEGPWLFFILESIVETICDSLKIIPIPFGSKIKVKRDLEDGIYETYTIEEYYGGVGDLFHVYICDPVSRFCYKKRKIKFIDTDYEQLKKERQWEAPELFKEEG